MEIRSLGPGAELPVWVEELDCLAFGDVWGPLDENELLVMLVPRAFARWRLILAAGEAELVRLAVAPGARRQGLARRLLEASDAILKLQSITELHLEVRTSNVPAIALYEAMGWKRLGTRKAYYRNGEDAALYRRDI
jgi:ribosomal-protein-alanine N-acetyltransferase